MVGLLEGIATTRAIRRFTDEPVTDEQLATILFAASRAPSGSNRQRFRFLVLREGAEARQARALLGDAARAFWHAKRAEDGYDEGSGGDPSSPKARLARVMDDFAEGFDRVPAIVIAGLLRYRQPHPGEGASVYPACQNLLLGARSIGLGGVLTQWHALCEPDLRRVLQIPDEVALHATIALGHPAGHHGPVRRRPIAELAYEGAWGRPAPWAIDPPGTRFTQAGPPGPRGR
jgi:nitroreductase